MQQRGAFLCPSKCPVSLSYLIYREGDDETAPVQETGQKEAGMSDIAEKQYQNTTRMIRSVEDVLKRFFQMLAQYIERELVFPASQ